MSLIDVCVSTFDFISEFHCQSKHVRVPLCIRSIPIPYFIKNHIRMRGDNVDYEDCNFNY